jgi:hypothetical protein
MTREPRTLQIRIPEPEIIPLNRWGYLALDTEIIDTPLRTVVIWDANDWYADEPQ